MTKRIKLSIFTFNFIFVESLGLKWNRCGLSKVLDPPIPMGPSPRVVTNAFPVVGRLGHPLVLGVHLCAPCWPRSRPRGKRACVERDYPASIPQVLSWRGCLWFPQGTTRRLWLAVPLGRRGFQSIPFGLAARVQRTLVDKLALQSFHVLAAWPVLACPLGSLIRLGGGRCSVSFPSHLRRRLACGSFLSTSLRLAFGILTPRGSSLAADPQHPLGKATGVRPPPGFPGCQVFPQGKKKRVHNWVLPLGP